VNDPRELHEFVEQYIAYLDGNGARPSLGDLPEELRTEAVGFVAATDSARGVAARADVRTDPLALRLGLNSTEDRQIDGTRVRRLRVDADLKVSEVVAAVARAGGTLSSRVLLLLESSTSFPVSSMTAVALGAVLSADVTEFLAAQAPSPLDDAEIERSIERWASEMERPARQVRAEVSRQLATASFRAEDTSVEHLREMVRRILDSMK
jgi:hypothetical protein